MPQSGKEVLSWPLARIAIEKYLEVIGGHEWFLENEQGCRVSISEVAFILTNQPPRRKPDRHYYLVKLVPPGVIEIGKFRTPIRQHVFDKADLLR